MKARILLVEDEENFGMVLKNYLELSDYSVDLAVDGDLGYSRFKTGNYDLIIMDVMMPHRDGFTLAKDIRKLNQHIPIIFLTARGEKEDYVNGYRSGADDYLTKPFDSEVLLLKISAILSRLSTAPSSAIDKYELGDYEFFPSLRELKSGVEVERLSPKENDLLLLLSKYKNRVMPRDEALITIWHNDDYFSKRSMDVYVTKLRKKLSGDQSLTIENIHGKGYILRIPE
ncbi:MAG: response regulator transcription factor [Bacteroidota bacterium]